MKKPKYLYRSDDGERFTRQRDGYYTMDNSQMYRKYRYSHSILKKNGFVNSLDECGLDHLRYLDSLKNRDYYDFDDEDD
jgi:hypothetical protein